ncbi:uncharacterized protein J7T54_006482 [Emericellopsis cladophorae]|uniref:Uncharacterized protein n=1 Tax=Emericellopsis cladophorae TaxID=2686198 RepID=A0A9P9Y6M0_9HYPO|nr:uncharacterized protein J7T54_006482 [Emericellopsis cladophorae]KAI6784437.1 hypothetical protein J7T54_006482 [Emericellopsis cladophorae]
MPFTTRRRRVAPAPAPATTTRRRGLFSRRRRAATPTTTSTRHRSRKTEVHHHHHHHHNHLGGGAPVSHHKRHPTMKDKISGAMLKLKGSLTHRPGQKAAGTRRMHGTDGRGARRRRFL